GDGMTHAVEGAGSLSNEGIRDIVQWMVNQQDWGSTIVNNPGTTTVTETLSHNVLATIAGWVSGGLIGGAAARQAAESTNIRQARTPASSSTSNNSRGNNPAIVRPSSSRPRSSVQASDSQPSNPDATARGDSTTEGAPSSTDLPTPPPEQSVTNSPETSNVDDNEGGSENGSNLPRVVTNIDDLKMTDEQYIITRAHGDQLTQCAFQGFVDEKYRFAGRNFRGEVQIIEYTIEELRSKLSHGGITTDPNSSGTPAANAEEPVNSADRSGEDPVTPAGEAVDSSDATPAPDSSSTEEGMPTPPVAPQEAPNSESSSGDRVGNMVFEDGTRYSFRPLYGSNGNEPVELYYGGISEDGRYLFYDTEDRSGEPARAINNVEMSLEVGNNRIQEISQA
ncbi:MAG: hypothetical protein KDJ52_32200, partial [Anaerolineae bacterium]|nr:hypothetical protein [Anaerolineae bacterium]